MAELNVVREEVFALYQRQDYDRVLEVAQSVANEFPANASYWIACMLAVTDRPDEALAALEQGLERGAYWPSRMLLKDPDLESIRADRRFARIIQESERAWKSAFDPGPEIHAFPPTVEPSGVLVIALDGAPGASVEEFSLHWQSARDQGALVVIPQSSQPHAPEGGRTWADGQRTKADLAFVYQDVSKHHEFDPEKVVLAGFSQGGRVAISIALRRDPISACGFIAVAPTVVDDPLTNELDRQSNLRGSITVGEDDWVLDAATSLHETATARGLSWRLDLVPRVAHEFPPDFDSRLLETLSFVA
ncbi:MAG: TPR end-of-group domain-containing protein [Actinomycetota bacterium]